MERWKKLAYDVGVNVVANLIAAAIIYLLGAWIGLFPNSPTARITASVFLGLVVIMWGGLIVAARASNERTRQYATLVVLLGLSVASGVSYLVSGQSRHLLPAGLGVVLAGLITIGLWRAPSRRDQGRHDDPTESR